MRHLLEELERRVGPALRGVPEAMYEDNLPEERRVIERKLQVKGCVNAHRVGLRFGRLQ